MKLELAAFRILGIKNATDPITLLGISRWDGNVTTLETALRIRVAQILSHPMRHSPEAELVREAIKEAGKVLRLRCTKKEPASIARQETVHALTPLDRSIIAVLVSEGGWNRQSRSRLVGVAAAYGLTVGGLLRVLSALAESARNGEGPLSWTNRKDESPNRSWATLPISSKKQSLIDELMDEAASRLMPEFKEQTPEAIIKLSVLFGILTLLAIVLGLMVINTADEEAKRVRQATDELLRINATVPSQRDSINKNIRSSIFDVYPSFEEDIFTPEVGKLVDLASHVPRTLQEVTEIISSSGARGTSVPQETIEKWDISIGMMSQIWPFLDQGLQEEVGELIVETMSYAQQVPKLPSILLTSFTVDQADRPNTSQMNELSFVRKPWILGELARIVCSPEIIPSTKNRAKAISDSHVLHCDILETRRAAIGIIGIQLVDSTELQSKSLSFWEQWLAMVNREQVSTVADSLKVQVVESILLGTVDLTRSSTTQKVLGRLVKEIDWTKTNQIRDSLLAFYVNEKISQVDLWTVSNMLVEVDTIPWFLTKHVVNIDDDFTQRRATADSLRKIWPEASKPDPMTHALILPAGFDSSLVHVWEELIKRCQDESLNIAARYTLTRRLNEIAAAFWLGRPSRAWELVDNLDQTTQYDEEYQAHKVGRSSGLFSNQIKQKYRDPQDMLELLNTIRGSNYSQLHQKDATSLARVALFYSDDGIRRECVSLICDQFSDSPEVAVALVNLLTSNSKTTQVESLVAYLSDEILPSRHDSLWLVRARRAFVQHALTAGRLQLKGLDEAAVTSAASALGESLLVDPTRLPPSQETTIAYAYTQLIEAWNRRLGNTTTFQSRVSADSTGGVLESHLQRQLQYLLRIQELETRWSGVRSEHNDLLQITNASTLLEQIREAEYAALQVWHRIISLAMTEYEKQEMQL